MSGGRGAPPVTIARPIGAPRPPARLLAAADVCHALREPQAHRPPHDAKQATDRLVAETAAGRLDRAAVAAILDVVGAESQRARTAWPRGLTSREVEVLRLLARGHSNKEIAAALGISPRTAQHPVIHICQKIGRNSRALPCSRPSMGYSTQPDDRLAGASHSTTVGSPTEEGLGCVVICSSRLRA